MTHHSSAVGSTMANPATAPTRASALYRAIWRWHFYAGLFTLPFLVLLAITGGFYLFKPQLDPMLYRSYHVVDTRNAPPLTHTAIVDRAQAAVSGPLSRYEPATSPTSSAEVVIKTTGGDVSVFVDPYDGRILGQLAESQNALWIVRKIHSLVYFGTWPSYLIELAAGWAIVLALTGLYLWWPRGRRGGVVSVRGNATQRIWWRDLHAVTGLVTAAFILFLAVTGMPWSKMWGDQLSTWADAHGYGYPAGVWSGAPESTMSMPMGQAVGETSWTMQNAPMPNSTETGAHPKPIGLDAAMAAFARMGMQVDPGLRINLPIDEMGVYTAQLLPDDVRRERTIHLDQYSGKPLMDARLADYGWVAQLVEWGVSIHMGRQFGFASQVVLGLACLAIILMSVSAAIMWWKRRPVGKIGAPQRLTDDRIGFGILVIAAGLGVFYPFVGISILAFLCLDFLLPKSWKSRYAL